MSSSLTYNYNRSPLDLYHTKFTTMPMICVGIILNIHWNMILTNVAERKTNGAYLLFCNPYPRDFVQQFNIGTSLFLVSINKSCTHASMKRTLLHKDSDYYTITLNFLFLTF